MDLIGEHHMPLAVRNADPDSIILSLHEGLDVDGRDDPRLMAKRAQNAADKVRAQARLHAHEAAREGLERVGQRQSPDLTAKRDRAVRAEADQVEDILANV